MTNELQELQDEQGAALGDPRRCPRHPSEVTSSPDGMFDAPCGACEMEADAACGPFEAVDIPGENPERDAARREAAEDAYWEPIHDPPAPPPAPEAPPAPTEPDAEPDLSDWF